MRFHKYKIEIKKPCFKSLGGGVGIAAGIIIFISVLYLHLCIQVYLRSTINYVILQEGISWLNMCCFLQLCLYVYIL